MHGKYELLIYSDFLTNGELNAYIDFLIMKFADAALTDVGNDFSPCYVFGLGCSAKKKKEREFESKGEFSTLS